MPFMGLLHGLTSVALSSEGGGTLTKSLADSKTLITWVLDLVTENWLLSIAFVMAILVPAAVKGFKGLKRTVK